jgi:hypothetical protein
MIVTLLGYAPDADPTVIGVLTNCSGVVPSLRGMKGAPSPAITPLAALARTCQGAAAVSKLDDTTRLFAGTAIKLYEAGVSTWSDVSRAASYTGGTTSRWRFAQQSNVSFAANGADTMQASVNTGPFSCVAGAPVAKIVESVGQFLFGFNTSSSAQGWQCSALGDYTSWTVSAATQAVSGTLISTPGPITAGRRFGGQILAYKQSSLYVGTYVGAPVVWDFVLVPGTAGALSQEVVVNIGTPDNPKHIFMGQDDFYVFDGSRPVPIGTNRVKVKVFNEILQSRSYVCTALHDKKNALVYFYYPVSEANIPDHCVVYNYRTDKWGVDDRQVEATVDYVTTGLTYTTLGGSYTTYDDLPSLPYDLAFLNPSDRIPAIFDTGHLVKTMTGPATSTSFTTGDFGDDVDFNCVTRIRPRFLTAPDSATLINYYRNNTGDSLTTDMSVALTNGAFDFMRDAKWHRFMVSLTGDWELAGFSPEWEKTGRE